jgi:hypothetical protein
MKKMPIPESERYKRTKSITGMLRYQTEIPDVGRAMPAASASRPIPRYDAI